ncbi:RagB/SusD family nutrient uptake outer membrane protein [Arundinibacter roseus]|uniref:RagB/SusD family nutrient uptake outer membrane protein n=1 Tax=Arundinibacter roseus TaxID=2070510 RepID=A0A4R4K5Y9_9BACT|nr:RagB/SusD family nutrient uptake outer membrane protein [Arundinibacter roseus]TDB62733.1 RagB/SusD family nutrient uptake outer membrane protein [Arundinibacter roseus]
MKTIHKFSLILALFVCCLLPTACQDFLAEDVYTQYAPQDFLQSEDGIKKVLVGAYSRLQINGGMREDQFTLSEFPTDMTLTSGGQFEKDALPFINFQWDASSPFFRSIWVPLYTAVRNANVLLENIDNVTSIPPARLAQYKAEAQFIRAEALAHLYRYFGPVPLVLTTSTEDLFPAKPTNDEFVNFISSELTAAAAALPVSQDLRGKADKGTALAVLTKFYLNTRQWQKCADTALELIDLKKYSLFPEIENLFAVANENNSEFIYIYPCLAQGPGNVYMPHAFPPNYPILSNWINYGAQFRTYTAFYKTFDPADRRLRMFITEYTDTRGNKIKLLEDANGKPLDDVRSFKYTPDPNAISQNNGNDIPVIRYADILLSRAEALNELQGPTQQALDLINQVRARAGVTPLSLADFSSKESLRDHLLKERGWEFFTEGKRREDLIRMDKFISSAVARGKNAEPFHVLYPIPQSEVEANPNLTQNTGY